MNLLLVGFGNYAKEAHLHGISTFEKTGHRVVLHVADLKHPAISPPGRDGNSWFIQLDENPERSEVILSAEHQTRRFDACIVATSPRFHKLYAQWALSNGIPVLVDKPLTFPDKAHVQAAGARECWRSRAQLRFARRRWRRNPISIRRRSAD